MKLLLIGLIVVCLLAIWFLSKQLPSSWRISSKITKTSSLEQKYKLIFYFSDLENNQDTWGCFLDQGKYYLVHASDLSIVPVEQVYPGFKGRPLGIVYYHKEFIVFSSDGYVYNPYSGSHLWRRDYFYLPNENFLSVDATLAGVGQRGVFNAGKNGDILFTFYYSTFSISEQVCVQPFNNLPTMKCPNVQNSFPHPPFALRSLARIGGILTAVSSDGFLYTLSPTGWQKSVNWTTIFGAVNFPTTPLRTEKGMSLLGADFDSGVPIFLLRDSGKIVLVDRIGRKHPLSPPGNILDVTKISDNDYFCLLDDNSLWSPVTNKRKRVTDFETLRPMQENCVSISHLRKWQPDLSSSNSTRKDYLVFFYPSGKWFEIHYDVENDKIEELGESDTTSTLWTSFEHLQGVSTVGAKLSAFGWSAFLTNGNVVSFHFPSKEWKKMLYCTPDNDELPDICVGKGAWDVPSTTISSKQTLGNYTVYNDRGIQLDLMNPDTILKKVSLTTATQKAEREQWEFLVYDGNESNAYYFHQLLEKQTFPLIEMSVFVRNGFQAIYLNRFCLQTPQGQYLYWDFTNPNAQFLGVKDICLPDLSQDFTGTNLTATGVIEAQKGLGSIWSFENGMVKNINAAVGGFLLPNLTLGNATGFQLGNNTLLSSLGCLNSDSSGKLSLMSTGCSNWAVTQLNCPSSTGYIQEYCT